MNFKELVLKGIEMMNLENRIKQHEGLSLKPYRDSLGNWTIGYGHKMDTVSQHIQRHGLSEEEANHLFDLDFKIAERGLLLLSDRVRRNCNEIRRGILIEMIFQMGIYGVMKFKKMLVALEVPDFEVAADEMLDSRWYRQTPKRCLKLSEIMRHGNETSYA